uniref:Ataxin-7-like protein 3 n=1 Tax=Neogobius melanostomus TaxID=47308 RepID=A0A8C6UPY4_9GOBI
MKMEDMPLSGPDNTRLEALVHDIYSELVDDACLGLSFEVHRAVKQGYFFLDETDQESMKEFEIVDQPGVDIFGQVYNQWKNKECECPNCKRLIAASRFAPHLEKCLGMGRNSSRIANRRLATNNTMSKSESDQEDNDDLNDNDWSYGNQTSPRRSKSLKHKNGTYFFRCRHYNYSSGINYETLGPDEVRSVLTTGCVMPRCPGRSQRCPQHTDEQRRAARVFLLGRPPPLPDVDAVMESDTFDIPDGQSLMSRLQWEDSPDVSPTDSASSKATCCAQNEAKTLRSRSSAQKMVFIENKLNVKHCAPPRKLYSSRTRYALFRNTAERRGEAREAARGGQFEDVMFGHF